MGFITFVCIISFFIAIVIGDFAQILEAPSIINVGCIDTGDEIRTRAILSLVLAVFLFLHLMIFFVKNLAILGLLGIKELVGGLILILGLVSKISSNKNLTLGRNHIRKTVTL